MMGASASPVGLLMWEGTCTAACFYYTAGHVALGTGTEGTSQTSPNQPGAAVYPAVRKDCFGDSLPSGAPKDRHSTVAPRVLGLLRSFSPDGKTLASGGDDQAVRFWEASTGREILVLPRGGSGVYSVAFSPNAKLLAAGSADGTIRLSAPSRGNLITSLRHRRSNYFSRIFAARHYVTSAAGMREISRSLCGASAREVIRQFKRRT